MRRSESVSVTGFGTRSGWSRIQAERIERTAATTAPIIYPPSVDPAPDVHVWDTWFLRNRDGSIAEIDGWRVVFSLTAPADRLPGKRHDVATIRYFYSRDGKRWHDGGPVFEAGNPLGSRQWAGSALYDGAGEAGDGSRSGGEIYLFYTAAGHRGESELSYRQRIAAASGGRVRVTDDEFGIAGPFDHEILLTPDGDRYETEAQSRGPIYTFRDPWFFEDPETGRTHLLFEANTPVRDRADLEDDDPSSLEFNGSIGLATSPTGDPTDWEFERPLVDAVRVNQELERPHVIYRDGRYHLFFSSHRHTFAPGLDGPDGLYGFVADSLQGEYRPLNDSGLVLTNPESAPYQAYSWLAYPHDGEILVSSFFNYYDLGSLHIDDVGSLPAEEQFSRFGGTLAPTVRLALEGDRTRVRGTLDHWQLPAGDDALPPLLTDLVDATDEQEDGTEGYDTGADSPAASAE
ncbi:glycoside hydrolase family 68 protein [Natrinema salinisoli]|uniref:glycoside hydrolase family 68 protein n=1 Tax=Natrinema salinisoli TaxID=2878535 RepID=UPI001CEFE8AF|nr:glycoside hydrolase family 68 protein [Natrinema salinisoli]